MYLGTYDRYLTSRSAERCERCSYLERAMLDETKRFFDNFMNVTSQDHPGECPGDLVLLTIAPCTSSEATRLQRCGTQLGGWWYMEHAHAHDMYHRSGGRKNRPPFPASGRGAVIASYDPALLPEDITSQWHVQLTRETTTGSQLA